MGALELTFARQLIGIYSTDPHVIEMGVIRSSILALPYFLCGMMDVLVGSLRGMGNSFVPMIISIAGVCVFRVGWVYTVFAAHHTLQTLYLSYPVSWAMTALAHFVCFLLVRHNLIKKMRGDPVPQRA